MYFYEKMKDLKTEIWKPVKGYEGLYEVSNLGNVRSVDRHLMWGNQYCLFKGKPKKSFPNSMGYLRTGLYKNGQGKHYFIHRLVAEAFIPNPNNLPCIDHIDRNYLNNSVDNLRWCTQKENCNNPLTREYANIKNRSKEVNEKRLATRRKNQSWCCEIPVYYVDEDGSKISFKSISEAERKIGCSRSTIAKALKKNRPVHGIQFYVEIEKATIS